MDHQDALASGRICTASVHQWQVVIQREPPNRFTDGWISSSQQQAAVRFSRKCAYRMFDFNLILNRHSDDRYAEYGPCHGDRGSKLTPIVEFICWKDICDPGQARHGLLEQLQPPTPERSESVREPGHVAFRSRYVAHQ